MRPVLQSFAIDPDADTVAVFQALATLNLQIRNEGESVPTLLRKAALEHGLGDYAAERSSTEHALALQPGHREALYRRALACIGLALVRSGHAEGHNLPTKPARITEHPVFWLDEAAYSLKRILLDGDDPEARAVLADVHDLIKEAMPK